MGFTRRMLDMDPDWRFHKVDNHKATEEDKSHSAVYNASKAGKAIGPATAGAFDDGTWEVVNLPHDYLREADFSPDAIGNHGYRVFSDGWYRKTFSLDPSLRGSHVMLVFEGISTSSVIYLNGSVVERSFSLYTEIAIDVTDRIYFDRINTLAVYTRGDDIEGWWYEGAGIYRHVRLYVKHPLHIAHNGIWAKPVLCEGCENDWRVELEATVENSTYEPMSAELRARLLEGDIPITDFVRAEVNCRADGAEAVHVSFSVKDPRRWDVDDPRLYTVEVELLQASEVIDRDRVRIGFRTFSIDVDRGFFLNGRPLKLKGTCNHQDHAGVGVAVPDSIQYYRIRRLKEMGCNAYRCAHNPPAKEILDACDELGMIVMDENRKFEANRDNLRYLEITVRRDRNHPCVLFYSLFNEEPLQNASEGLAIFRRLRSCVERLDDTRLFLGAINGNIHKGGTCDGMDVFGLNYNLANLEVNHREHPQKPILGSENSSAVTTRGCYRSDREVAQILNNYDEEVVPWGQTIRETWKCVYENDYMAGAFVWTGFDYRGEPTPFVWPSCSSQFGILDTCGFPKDSYYFHQAIFFDEPMLHLMPHWNWSAGEVVRVMAVTNCDEVELFLNGRSLGKQTGGRFDPCEWKLPFESGTLSAIGYRCGKAVATAERKTAGPAARILLTPDRTTFQNGGQDTVPVRVSLVDANGVELPTASDRIDFSVEGDGFVAGVGNGDPNSHEPDHAPYRHLYCGLCQVLVTATRGAKALKLIARANGLPTAEVSFAVERVPLSNAVFYQPNYEITELFSSVEDSDEKPDPAHVYGDDDMNSFTPIVLRNAFNTFSPRKFHRGWRELRIPIRLPAQQTDGKMAALAIVSVVCARAEFYVDGKQIFAATPAYKAPLTVPLDFPAGSSFELRCLLKAGDRAMSNGIGLGISLTEIDRPNA